MNSGNTDIVWGLGMLGTKRRLIKLPLLVLYKDLGKFHRAIGVRREVTKYSKSMQRPLLRIEIARQGQNHIPAWRLLRSVLVESLFA